MHKTIRALKEISHEENYESIRCTGSPVRFDPARARANLPGLLVGSLALAFGTQQLSASVTYIVGTCKTGTHFTTIQSALDASPAPTTVEVCPGQYNEQITITKPVTLEGISQGNDGQVHSYSDVFTEIDLTSCN